MKYMKGKDYIKDVLFIISLIAKIVLFYLATNISKNSMIVGLVTFAVVISAYYSYLYHNKINSWKRFFGIYSAISILMFLDAMYYNYFNQLISINQMFQADKLLSIVKSIRHASLSLNILLIADLPIVYKYIQKKHKEIRIDKNSLKKMKIYRKCVSTALALAILVIVINPFNADAVKSINRNEVITYHLQDIYSNVFGDTDFSVFSEEQARSIFEENKEISQEKHLNGIGKNKNLVVIQVESMQNFPINRSYNGQELTPNLNRLLKEDSIYFDNYFQSIGKGNTSDAEFATLNSLYPNLMGSCYEKYAENTFYGLPWIMKEYGYKTISFHGYKGKYWNREQAHNSMGFDDFISKEDFNVTTDIGFGMADEEMFEQAAEKMADIENPFFSFLITLSCHHPYEIPDEFSQFRIKEEDKETVFGNYMRAVNYSDKSLGIFIEKLKEKGIYENSVIAIYGDHHGLNRSIKENHEKMTSFLGREYGYQDMMNIPLIIHIPGYGNSEIKSITGGQIDFLPTIANIMGIEINNPFIAGRDLINSEEGFSAFVTYLFRGSYITDSVIFRFSEDMIYEESEAFNRSDNSSVDISKCRDNYEKAKKLIDASKYVLENDLIKRH